MSPAGANRAGDAVATFLTSFWARHPVTATFAGASGHDGAYPDWSPEALDASLLTLRAERDALAEPLALAEAALASAPWPDAAPLVDLRLADTMLEIEIAERAGLHFHRGNPVLATGEAVFGIISLMLRHDRPLDERHAHAVRRLEAMPAFLEGARRSLARPIPLAWRDRAARDCEGAAVLLRDGLPVWYAEGGADLPAAVATAQAALTDHAAWLSREAPIDTANSVSAGAVMFGLMLARGHWSNRPASTWRRDVSEQFALARGRLSGMAGALAPGGWAEVEARLAMDLPTSDRYLPELHECWAACRAKALEMQYVDWPDAPLRFAPPAEGTRAAAPYLYYLPYRCPAPLVPTGVHTHEVAPLVIDASGTARVSPGMTRAQIKLNHVVHHAALGHHVQNWYAARSASQIGRVTAVDGASRIAMFRGGALAEGWACYATDLMDEAGFLTPDERVAEQHTRVRLLARALMDIELHTGERSLDDVARFYALEVGMGDAAARNEAVKNSMFPGAAIMYWLGLDGIHELRLARATRDGEVFDLRAFHHEILAMGAIPVPMIAERLSLGSA